MSEPDEPAETARSSSAETHSRGWVMVGASSTVIGLLNGAKNLYGGSHLDDFVYQVGNTAAAVIAVAFCLVAVTLWMSWIFGSSDIPARFDGVFVSTSVLLGFYWANAGHYDVERFWGRALGGVILIGIGAFVYDWIFSSHLQSRTTVSNKS